MPPAVALNSNHHDVITINNAMPNVIKCCDFLLINSQDSVAVLHPGVLRWRIRHWLDTR